MELYHFSEDPSIERFVTQENPRRTDAPPLVWAIDEDHQHMYLFPRDCPRILLWPVPGSSAEEVEQWFGSSRASVVAYVEYGWLERISNTELYRYRMRTKGFEDINDAGMWVSRDTVEPLGVEPVGDLFEALSAAGVEIRALPRLTTLKGLNDRTTLHWSAIRMGNALDWGPTDSSPMPEGFRS